MSLKKNIISNTVLTTSSVFISFLTFPYITRTLSAANLGSMLFIDAFTQYFIIFSALGIPYYGVREIAKLSGKPEEQSRLVFSLVTLQFVLSIISSLAFLGIGYFIPALRDNWGMVVLGCLTILSSSFTIEWFYQGTENFSYITKRALIVRILCVIAIFFFVKALDDHFVYYLIIFCVIFVNAALNFGNYVARYYRKFPGSIRIFPHLRPLMILFSINVSMGVYAVLDTILLGLLTDPEYVSFYSIPMKLVKIVLIVVGGFSIVLIPRISQHYLKGDMEEVDDLLKKSLNLVFLVTLPFSLLCIFFSKEILFAIFGAKYLGADTALMVLSVIPLILGICNVFGTQFLLPIGHERKVLHATICGLITSLALNFLLIPHFKHVGSSMASVAAETVVCLYVYFKARSKINVKLDYSLLLMIGIASAITIVAGTVLKKYLHDYYLLATVFMVYGLVFAILQFLVFRNQFIFFVLRIKTKTNG